MKTLNSIKDGTKQGGEAGLLCFGQDDEQYSRTLNVSSRAA